MSGVSLDQYILHVVGLVKMVSSKGFVEEKSLFVWICVRDRELCRSEYAPSP
jgi:hypothetical protein